MEAIDTAAHRGFDIEAASRPCARDAGWTHVVRDVLVFQFKLVVDGLKDLGLAQVALGAALIDVLRRDGSPGRRFYAIVRMSDRFDRWLDLHEPLERVPEDAPHYFPTTPRSVDDLLDGVESSARSVADLSVRASRRGVETLRREAARHTGARRAGEAFGGA